jgi:hypothetical protein
MSAPPPKLSVPPKPLTAEV